MITRIPVGVAAMFRVCLFVGLSLSLLGCGESPPKTGPQGKTIPAPAFHVPWKVDLPHAELRSGTAVAILIDTSGSMGQKVRDKAGKQRPKSEIAREALEGIVGYTGKWKKDHVDRPLYLGIYSFSSSVATALPMGEFEEGKAKAALARIPSPNSGTAIGVALEEGFKALYGSGCVRKYVVCITDGENTSGPKPDVMARQLFTQTEGAVEIQFVAFDVAASRFQFLRDVNGHVTEAADGTQLQTELSKTYEKRILAEAEEPEPKK